MTHKRYYSSMIDERRYERLLFENDDNITQTENIDDYLRVDYSRIKEAVTEYEQENSCWNN